MRFFTQRTGIILRTGSLRIFHYTALTDLKVSVSFLFNFQCSIKFFAVLSIPQFIISKSIQMKLCAFWKLQIMKIKERGIIFI